jgi:hypothetical protein
MQMEHNADNLTTTCEQIVQKIAGSSMSHNLMCLHGLQQE